MKKIIQGTFLFSLLVISYSLTAFAEEAGTEANTKNSNGEIISRLSRIEAKEEEILRRLDEMKSELQIIKVRATLKS